METTVTESHAADVVDRLWRAYAPFQRGRNTVDDFASMLAILALAGVVVSVGEPEDELVKLWGRAVAEAHIDVSPLKDLRVAMTSASRRGYFPVLDLFASGEEPEDVPWAGAVLAALELHPTPTEAGLSEVCELLLERHVQEGTISAGEFHTPRAVARLLIDLASPQPGDRILDPACGSGGLLAAAAQRIAQPGRVDGAAFEAYATDRSNLRLAMMNMAIHGVDRPLVRASDPVSLLQSRSNGVVEHVVSNPPFNQRIKNADIGPWPFGPPPESNANFAWLQLAWARLSKTGTAMMIMPQRAAWSTGREAEIRRRMITDGALLGIVALPPNLFTNTSILVHIWMLARDKSRHLPIGDANEVLFIDAGRLGTQAPRQTRVLTKEDVERISGRLHAWLRSPRTTSDEPEFSRSVTHEEILENDGNLDPRLYVDVDQDGPTTAVDLSRTADELDRHNGAMSNSIADLRKTVELFDRLTRGRSESSRVQLREVVQGTAEGASADPGQLFAGPSGSLIRADDHVDAGIPIVMPKDLVGNGFSTASIRYITEQQARSLERFRLRRGDVVLARRGELGRCAVVREEQQGWVCGTGCFLLRPPAELDADYIAAYLRSPEARTWLDSHSTGSTVMKTISLDVLGMLPVALPDLGTQQAVARVMMRLEKHERLLQDQFALTQKIHRDALNSLLEE